METLLCENFSAKSICTFSIAMHWVDSSSNSDGWTLTAAVGLVNGNIAQPDISNIWHVDKCVSRNLKLSVKSGSGWLPGRCRPSIIRTTGWVWWCECVSGKPKHLVLIQPKEARWVNTPCQVKIFIQSAISGKVFQSHLYGIFCPCEFYAKLYVCLVSVSFVSSEGALIAIAPYA